MSAKSSAGISIDPTAYLAPGAALVGTVTLGPRSSVWFHVTLRGDIAPIRVGADSNIQDGAVVHVDRDVPALIGQRVTLGHGAIVHASTIEDDVLVAMKAVVLSGCHVGRHSLIGAGAVLPEGTRIPEGSLVLGVPGKVVRPLTPEEVERVHRNASAYVELARAYREGAFTMFSGGAS